MKTKKCVSALLLSILMILSLVPTASATESGTATVITENEKAIIKKHTGRLTITTGQKSVNPLKRPNPRNCSAAELAIY